MNPLFAELLVCPVSRAKLRHQPATGELVADEAGLAYPIRHGVPVLLIEQARQLHPVPAD